MSNQNNIEEGVELVPAVRDCPIQLRSYQHEMFEKSLEGNTIVVMDTGSGKTAVAIYRIKHALERSEDKRLIWFLTGSVELCRQQYGYVGEAIPYAVTQIVVGEDAPELWGSSERWEKVLEGVDIMFSTFQILNHALMHAYVRIQDLGLLIFDEAHHVAKNNPANRIMQDFYHDVRIQGGGKSLPAILGLTASPTQNGKHHMVQQLEKNLEATCQTPRASRLELRKVVNRPIVKSIEYCGVEESETEIDLQYTALEQDKRLKKVMKKVIVLVQELGWWTAITFLHELLSSLQASIERFPDVSLSKSDRGKKDLLTKLRPIVYQIETFYNGKYGHSTKRIHVTDKVNILIQYLNKRVGDEGEDTLAGIVFACQRIVVTMLHKLLAFHPGVSKDIHVGAFVGAAGGQVYEKEPAELVITRDQSETLQKFRSGKINLIVSTDALDEGIDVAACNTIVCFDKPANLRSYVQKRGRARQARSVYVMMTDVKVLKKRPKDFEIIEGSIMKVIEEEERQAAAASVSESIEEDVDFILKSSLTGAMLKAQDIRAHLHHFCNKLPRVPYVDQEPKFSFEQCDDLIFAKVVLPTSVRIAVRQARSTKGWKTEKAAIRDAAFQAYEKLYRHGYLTEHLLPRTLEPKINDDFTELKQKYNHLGHRMCVWRTTFDLPLLFYQNRLIIPSTECETSLPNLILLTPMDLGCVGSVQLIVEDGRELDIECQPCGQLEVTDQETLNMLKLCTQTLLNALRYRPQSRWAAQYAVHVTPDLPLQKLQRWLSAFAGEDDAGALFAQDVDTDNLDAIVVNRTRPGWLGSFRDWSLDTDDDGEQILNIECDKMPRLLNFTRRTVRSQEQQKKAADHDAYEDNLQYIAAEDSSLLRVPSDYFWSMRLLPSIAYHVEMILNAKCLQEDLFSDVTFRNLPGVVQALTSPRTQIREDYERVEFLGDSILKYHTSCQIFCKNPTWHEGFMTRQRKIYVSNHPLAKAALDLKLDRYILNDAFKGKNWSLPTKDILAQEQELARHLDMKTVADVVEALIGAAFLGGGIQSARRCMSIILPEISSEAGDFHKFAEICHPGDTRIHEKAAAMLDYSFHSKYLLLEALTHPSCMADAKTESYQRLEFLGDAVLDFIVVTELYHRLPEASQSRLSTVKAALVNGEYLSFLCYSLSVESEITNCSAYSKNDIRLGRSKQRFQFSSLLQYDGPVIQREQQNGLDRFKGLQDEITAALCSDTYPWELLSTLNAPKFVSDMVESTLGAIFVDSNGEIAPCRRFLERLGLLDQLAMIVDLGMDVTHPYDALVKACRRGKLERKWDTNEDGSLHTLTILINEEEISKVADCTSKSKAILHAATKAMGNAAQQAKLRRWQ